MKRLSRFWVQLMYLYRAVDGQGNTVEFFLSRTRGICGGEGILSQGTETSSGATQHHLWMATSRAIAPCGAWE